jgi:hypothetical protein
MNLMECKGRTGDKPPPSASVGDAPDAKRGRSDKSVAIEVSGADVARLRVDSPRAPDPWPTTTSAARPLRP